MTIHHIQHVYFIGIGGIGMSALARYFYAQGKSVAGYDKTPTALTRQLEEEGIDVHYDDRGAAVVDCRSARTTLVIYTPAIPADMGELTAFQARHFEVMKRSEVLGSLTADFETYAVAGTHGKTTTTSILTHALNATEDKCTALIGGIAANYDSNCVIHTASRRLVVEADEFDRSFLHLHPDHVILTSVEADHLDSYGTGRELREAFCAFVRRTAPQGLLVAHAAVNLSDDDCPTAARLVTYGSEPHADWQLQHLRYRNGQMLFDIAHRSHTLRDLVFGLAGQHNAENATAVVALCMELGIPEAQLREALAEFKGIRRRFEFKIRRDDLAVIDDYAHHPTEVEALLKSVRKLYPVQKITLVFQPHLFSRTRDFMDAFARVLALADELIVLPIYPAREQPIRGVTSAALLQKVRLKNKQLSTKDQLLEEMQRTKKEVICIAGAGDIDTLVAPITQLYQS